MQKKDKVKKILLTGGHAATAVISVIEEIIRREDELGWDIYWVGAKKAIEGKSATTLESKYIPKLGVKHFFLFTGRVQRKLTFWTVPSIVKIPFGFFHAMSILLKVRPDVVLSFGGYVSVPVVAASYLLGIPVVIHEQTAVAGRANKLGAFFARKILLSRESSLDYFPRKKCIHVGNPLMSQIATILPKEKPQDTPVVYITGGSRGSITINDVIKASLNELLESYKVVHQVGEIQFKLFEKIRDGLSKEKRQKYQIYSSIDPMQVDNVYRMADVVVARAGANTVAEILATQRPSILVPIPWTYLNEQQKNAEYAQKLGNVKVIHQNEFKKRVLLSTIKELLDNWNFKSKSKQIKLDIHASKEIVDILKGI